MKRLILIFCMGLALFLCAGGWNALNAQSRPGKVTSAPYREALDRGIKFTVPIITNGKIQLGMNIYMYVKPTNPDVDVMIFDTSYKFRAYGEYITVEYDNAKDEITLVEVTKVKPRQQPQRIKNYNCYYLDARKKAKMVFLNARKENRIIEVVLQ